MKNSNYNTLTCQPTGMGALWPWGPVRQLAVDGTFYNTGGVHLPLSLQTQLQEESQRQPLSHLSINKTTVAWRKKCHTANLFAELEVNGFAVTSHTVQHASFDAISTHCSITELTSTPICREAFCLEKIILHTLITNNNKWLLLKSISLLC